MTVEGIDRRGKKVLRTVWVSLDLNICRCLKTEAMLDGQDSPNNQIMEKISIREEFFRLLVSEVLLYSHQLMQ